MQRQRAGARLRGRDAQSVQQNKSARADAVRRAVEIHAPPRRRFLKRPGQDVPIARDVLDFSRYVPRLEGNVLRLDRDVPHYSCDVPRCWDRPGKRLYRPEVARIVPGETHIVVECETSSRRKPTSSQLRPLRPGHDHIVPVIDHIVAGKNHFVPGKNHIVPGKNHIVPGKNHIVAGKNHIVAGKYRIAAERLNSAYVAQESTSSPSRGLWTSVGFNLHERASGHNRLHDAWRHQSQ